MKSSKTDKRSGPLLHRVPAEQWAQRVRRWRESGLTAREYAQELGCSALSLHTWAMRLGMTSKR